MWRKFHVLSAGVHLRGVSWRGECEEKQWVTGAVGEVGSDARGCGVSLGRDGNVLELGRGDGCTAL